MPALLILIVTLLLTLLCRPLAGRWPLGYWLGGLLFGLFNEFCFEFCWTYSSVMGPTVWRDLPILVLVGWGSMAMLSFSLVDAGLAKVSLRWRGYRGLLDVFCFVCIGFSAEVLLHSRGCWTYNFPLHELPVVQIVFYIGAGLLISSTGRRLDHWLSRETG